jgi:hypothetical protein
MNTDEIRSLRKDEVHVHLEGSMHPAALHEFAMRKAKSGVRYADLIFNTTHWPQWSDRLDDEGFSAAENDGGPDVKPCVSILRTDAGRVAQARRLDGVH